MRLTALTIFSTLVATTAMAQTTTPANPSQPGSHPSTATGIQPPGTQSGVQTGVPTASQTGNQPGAQAGTQAGAQPGAPSTPNDSNGAVNTSRQTASTPAHGANSFSQAEARDRIANHGFQNVSALKKDNQGVWHATASKGGQQVNVWLDYKGNVGQQP